MALFDTTATQSQSSMIGPAMKDPVTSPVDYGTETVEGRIGNLLGTDQRGNYTSPVVRQAQQRQEQAFNSRGLLNSSMAMQAAQEAATSKAIDIAAPDAQTYYNNRRQNVQAQNDTIKQENQLTADQAMSDKNAANQMKVNDAATNNDLTKQHDTQAFNLRGSYQKAVQDIGTNFQRQLDTINASNMTPEDKSVAIQQAQAQRDGEIAFQNNLYSHMPQWQQEWTAAVVPTAGMDISTIGNIDTLANIANDPGQPADVRKAATDRMAALSNGTATAGAPGAAAPGGSAGSTSNGYTLPQRIGGQSVNWNAPGIRGVSLATEYDRYAKAAGPNALPPDQWYLSRSNGGFVGGPGNGNNGEGAGSGGGVGAGGDNF